MTPSNRRVKANLPPDVLASRAAAATSVPPPAKPAKEPSKLVRALRALAGVVLILSISGVVAWGARKYVKSTPRFAVTEIVVSGGHRRSEDELVATSGVRKGANVFTVDLERARQRLVQDPWVLDATLARRLPGTVYLNVTERRAAALVALGDTYLASREGDIFKRIEVGDPTDLPIITGLTLQMLADDRDGCAALVRRALDLVSDYERMSLASRAPLQEVHIAGDRSTTLVVGKSAVVLHMGDPPFRRKLEQASRVFAELDRRGAKPDAVMLDNEGRPDRVVVRMR
jgi:cell division protein FtsQ